MSENITQEEKIDYIYLTLKKNQKRNTIEMILKWGYRITILGYMYYFFMISLPSIIEKIPSFSNPGESMNLQEIFQNPKIKELYENYITQ